MKASKFTEAQKAFILRQGEEGTPVAEICRKAGISQATYFNWKKRYGGLLRDEMRRPKALEDENGRLKKIVADLTLDREMLQDVIRRKLVRQCLSDHWRSIGSPWPDARNGSRDVHRLGRVDPRGVWGPAVRHLDVSLQIPAHGPGGRRTTDQGMRRISKQSGRLFARRMRDACAVRLSTRACPATPRRMGDQHEEDPKDLQ